MTPMADPGARKANAHRHPSASWSKAISQMLATVIVNTVASWRVRAVPA